MSQCSVRWDISASKATSRHQLPLKNVSSALAAWLPCPRWPKFEPFFWGSKWLQGKHCCPSCLTWPKHWHTMGSRAQQGPEEKLLPAGIWGQENPFFDPFFGPFLAHFFGPARKSFNKVLFYFRSQESRLIWFDRLTTEIILFASFHICTVDNPPNFKSSWADIVANFKTL